MREFGRFKLAGRAFYASVSDGTAIELSGYPWTDCAEGGAQWPLDDLVVLPPTTPALVVEADWTEAGTPEGGRVRFRLRLPETLIPHRGMVPQPAGGHRFSAHPGLAVVVGRTVHRADAAAARAAILGWTTAITFRDETALEEDPGAAGALNHAGFTAIGPAVRLESETPPGALHLWHNGRCLPNLEGASPDAATVLAAASDWAVFHPGDLLLLGSGGGADAIRPGDHVECRRPPLRAVSLNVGLRGSA